MVSSVFYYDTMRVYVYTYYIIWEIVNGSWAFYYIPYKPLYKKTSIKTSHMYEYILLLLQWRYYEKKGRKFHIFQNECNFPGTENHTRHIKCIHTKIDIL